MSVDALLLTLAVLSAASFALLAVLSRKLEVSRAALWLALVAPFLFTVMRTREEVESISVSSGLALHDLGRFGLPLALLMVGIASHPPLKRGLDRVEVLGLAFVGVAIASFLWSERPLLTLAKASALAVQYLAVIALTRRYRSIQGGLNGLGSFIALVLLSVPVGVLVAPGRAFDVTGGGTERLRGVFVAIHPNMLGLIAAVGLVCLLTRFGPQWASGPLARSALAALYVGEMLLARTRLALVVAVVGLALALLVERRGRRPDVVGVGLVGIAVGAVVMLFVNAPLTEFMYRGQTADQVATLTGRTEQWSLAIEVVPDQLWYGHGFYTGQRLAVPSVYAGANSSNLDNMWIEVLVDLGVLGAAALGAFLFVGLRRAWRVGDTEQPSVRACLIGSIAPLLLATTFNPSLQTVTFAGVILLYLVLVSGRPARDPRRQGADRAPHRAGVH